MTIFNRAKEPEQEGLRSMPQQPKAPEPVKAAQPPRPVVRPATPPVQQRPAVVAPVRVAVPAAATPAVSHPAPAAPVVEAAEAVTPRAPVAAPKPATPPSPNAAMLVAGAGVTLKGNMQCDMLRVEGSIEGDVKARKLVISSGGTLMGTAEIEDAEIEGIFEGTLIVSGHLVVRSTGRLAGKFQYGEIEIERGGAVTGEVQLHGQV
ncbi:bactofilin family protein [Rhizomicrobium electricum]|nr:polymer-forming cytoskeletal protein [Rhizomicrobium electricum]NIJ48887.1 cytoskeletal protein CcmA (bactofilin family) [Rhizomicrobium electricum]